LRLLEALGAKPVIDRCRLDEPGPFRGGKQQECKAVWTPGYGEAEPRVRRDERPEVAAKAVETDRIRQKVFVLHCQRSEAIQRVDCRVATLLAMTDSFLPALGLGLGFLDQLLEIRA